MKSLALYCKSYHTDLRRVKRLALSVQKFNADRLPLYVSVPLNELPLFREHLAGLDVSLLADEEIAQACPRLTQDRLQHMPGHLSQQVVKSEFWRLNLSDTYLCLDSDSLFIRKFQASDYLSSDGTPYTVINEAHDLLEMALTSGNTRVLHNFWRESHQVQALFSREGKAYSFGPMPMVWHRVVWESLDTNYLQPRGITLADAIASAPLESRWYGEALLAYQAIPLLPSEPFFKVYHHGWQWDRDRRSGLDLPQLANLYSGVIYQSSWERDMDWPQEGGHLASRIARRLRRKMKRF